MWSSSRSSDDELLESVQKVEEAMHRAREDGRLGYAHEDKQAATFEDLLKDIREEIKVHQEACKSKYYHISLFATLLYKYSTPDDDEVHAINEIRGKIHSVMESVERSTQSRDRELTAIAFLKGLPAKADLDSAVDTPIASPPLYKMHFGYPVCCTSLLGLRYILGDLDVPMNGLEEWWNAENTADSDQNDGLHNGHTPEVENIRKQLKIMARKIVFMMDDIHNMFSNRFSVHLQYLANMARKFVIYCARYLIHHPDNLEPINSFIEDTIPPLYALFQVTTAANKPFRLLSDFSHYQTHLEDQIRKLTDKFKGLLVQCEDLEIQQIIPILKHAAEQDKQLKYSSSLALPSVLSAPLGLAEGILTPLEDEEMWEETVVSISSQQQEAVADRVADTITHDVSNVEYTEDEVIRLLDEMRLDHILVRRVVLDGPACDTGRGSYSIVRKTTRIREKDNVVVKGFKTKRGHDDAPRLIHEAEIWAKLKHKNVLPLLGYSILPKETFPALVSPRCKYGSVHTFLEGTDVVISFKLRMLHDIIEGIEYLHSKYIFHGDLRAQNVLLNAEGRALLTDFGISDVVEDCKNLISDGAVTNARWLAFEFFDESNREPLRINAPSDMYAFGCLALQIFSLQRPYHNLSDEEVPPAKKQKLGPTRPEGIRDPYWEFMARFWGPFVGSRPTASEGRDLLYDLMVSTMGADDVKKLFTLSMSFFCDW